MKNKKIALLMANMALLSASSVFACVVSFHNDGTQPVKIKTVDKKEKVKIWPGKTKQFGSKKKHADFDLYEMNFQGKFVKKYTLKQTKCSADKFQTLSLSDIQQKKNIPFDVTPVMNGNDEIYVGWPDNPGHRNVKKSSCGCNHK